MTNKWRSVKIEKIYSKTGELAWSGVTDNSGNASFEIQFTDDNYSDAWSLRMAYEGKTISKDVTLLTSTPVELAITEQDQPAASSGSGGGGRSGGGGGGGGCFVATAAYGSLFAPEVQVLREFRDKHLLTNEIGKTLMKVYWTLSPDIASFIRKHAAARIASRLTLVPVVYGVKYPWLLGIIIAVAGMTFICIKCRKSPFIAKEAERESACLSNF